MHSHTLKKRDLNRDSNRDYFLRVSTQAEKSLSIWHTLEMWWYFAHLLHTHAQSVRTQQWLIVDVIIASIVYRERSARLAWWDIKNRYDFHSPFSHTSHRKQSRLFSKRRTISGARIAIRIALIIATFLSPHIKIKIVALIWVAIRIATQISATIWVSGNGPSVTRVVILRMHSLGQNGLYDGMPYLR